jgi:butyryl-CoA dehydrogenase
LLGTETGDFSFFSDNSKFLVRNYGICELSKEHKALQETCRSFTEKEIKPIATSIDRQAQYPKEIIEKLANLGLMRITVSPENDGCGLDFLALSLCVEELSRGSASVGAIVSIHNCLYANLVDRLGNEDQKRRFLKDFDLSAVGAFALSESEAGSDVANISTTATQEGDSYTINGCKTWVTSGLEAKAGVIFATVDKKLKHRGITAFLVDFDKSAVERGQNERKLSIKSTSTCNLYLTNTKIPKENVLQSPGDGFKIAMQQLERARIGIASQALGISQASLDLAVEYAKQRKAFDEPIIKLPAVKTRLAEMASRIEASRLLVRKAAYNIDSGQKATKSSSMAKLTSSECATFCAHNCQQILGGMGLVEDYPAERFYRDARVTEIYGGVSDVQKSVIADQVIKEYGGL